MDSDLAFELRITFWIQLLVSDSRLRLWAQILDSESGFRFGNPIPDSEFGVRSDSGLIFDSSDFTFQTHHRICGSVRPLRPLFGLFKVCLRI